MDSNQLLERFGINTSIEYNIDILLHKYLKEEFPFKDYKLFFREDDNSRIASIRVSLKYDLKDIIECVKQMRYNIWCNMFNQMCSSDKVKKRLYRVDFYTFSNKIKEPFNQESNFMFYIYVNINRNEYGIQPIHTLYPSFKIQIKHKSLCNDFDYIRIIDIKQENVYHIYTVQDLNDSKVKELQNNIIDSFSEDPIKYGAEMSFYNNYCYKYCGSFINEGD